MTPTKIHLHKKSQVLDIQFGHQHYHYESEFLRVHSPSAEVKGHAGEGGTLPTQKKNVEITQLEPAGNYALRIYFDDGHASGLYTWTYLHDLGENKEKYWENYLKRLRDSQQTREQGAQVLHFSPKN